MKAYVGGPMRGYPEFNFPTFDAVTSVLRDFGFTVANPAEHDREVYPDIEEWPGYASGDIAACPKFDFPAAMKWDLAQVLDADALVLLPGWQQSSGARHERYVAEVCRKRIVVAVRHGDGWLFEDDVEQVRVSA